MKRKRTTTISIETRRVIRLRNQQPSKLWCSECGQETDLLGIEETALLTHISTREIYRWIDGNRIHFTETSDGLVLVCLKGFLKLARQTGLY